MSSVCQLTVVPAESYKNRSILAIALKQNKVSEINMNKLPQSFNTSSNLN